MFWLFFFFLSDLILVLIDGSILSSVFIMWHYKMMVVSHTYRFYFLLAAFFSSPSPICLTTKPSPVISIVCLPFSAIVLPIFHSSPHLPFPSIALDIQSLTSPPVFNHRPVDVGCLSSLTSPPVFSHRPVDEGGGEGAALLQPVPIGAERAQLPGTVHLIVRWVCRGRRRRRCR